MKKYLFSIALLSVLLIPFSQADARMNDMDSHDEMMEMVDLMENGQLDTDSQKELAEHVNFLVGEKMGGEMMGDKTMHNGNYGPMSMISSSPLFIVFCFVHVLFAGMVFSLLVMLNIFMFRKLKKKK